MQVSAEQLNEWFPPDEIRAAYFRRRDIAALPPDEQERRWRIHAESLRRFLSSVATHDSIVI